MSQEPALLAAAALALAVACVATVVSASALARVGARLRLVDRPGLRKPQSAPVATVGGVAIVIGCIAGAAAARWLDARSGAASTPGATAIVPAFGAVAWLCFAVGLADDVSGKRMSAGVKALATLAALLLPMLWPMLWPLLVGDRGAASPWLRLLPLLPFAFVALHAMNTADHVNGLAASVALLGAAAFAVAETFAGARAGAPPGALGRDAGSLAALLAAALAGFLFLNFPRGRVFLGDSGTLLLGGCLATLLLERRRPELLLLAAVPLADLVSVAWLRVRAGAKPWLGDRRHVTHRLVGRGVRETTAVVSLAAVQAGCAALFAVAFVQRWQPGAAWALTIGVIAALALGMLAIADPSRR